MTGIRKGPISNAAIRPRPDHFKNLFTYLSTPDLGTHFRKLESLFSEITLTLRSKFIEEAKEPNCQLLDL